MDPSSSKLRDKNMKIKFKLMRLGKTSRNDVGVGGDQTSIVIG